MRGEDGDMEVLREDLQQKEHEVQRLAKLHDLPLAVLEDTEDDMLADGVPPIAIAESETRHVISEMLNQHE